MTINKYLNAVELSSRLRLFSPVPTVLIKGRGLYNAYSTQYCYVRTVADVRLGETDLTTTLDCLDLSEQPSCVCEDNQCPIRSEDDCFTAGQCADRHVLRGVARQSIHPQYDPSTWVGFKGWICPLLRLFIGRSMILG